MVTWEQETWASERKRGKWGDRSGPGCCSLFAHSDAAARLAVVSRCGGSVFSVRFQSAGLGQWSHIGGRCKLRLLGISEIVRTGLGQPSYTGGFGKRGMLAWKQLGARWLVLRLLDPMGTSVLLGRVSMSCSADVRVARQLRGVLVHAQGRVLRALRCDVIAVRRGGIWTST